MVTKFVLIVRAVVGDEEGGMFYWFLYTRRVVRMKEGGRQVMSADSTGQLLNPAFITALSSLALCAKIFLRGRTKQRSYRPGPVPFSPVACSLNVKSKSLLAVLPKYPRFVLSETEKPFFFFFFFYGIKFTLGTWMFRQWSSDCVYDHRFRSLIKYRRPLKLKSKAF